MRMTSRPVSWPKVQEDIFTPNWTPDATVCTENLLCPLPQGFESFESSRHPTWQLLTFSTSYFTYFMQTNVFSCKNNFCCLWWCRRRHIIRNPGVMTVLWENQRNLMMDHFLVYQLFFLSRGTYISSLQTTTPLCSWLIVVVSCQKHNLHFTSDFISLCIPPFSHTHHNLWCHFRNWSTNDAL